MPADLEAWLAHFALVLTRVTAALTFVPFPGLRQASLAPRAGLALAVSTMLTPALMLRETSQTPWTLNDAVWNLPVEAALGLGAGVIVGWALEVFTLGMQMLSLHAGFSYASTIDPATQADSGVLQVAGQLTAGLLFVTIGWERELLGAFAKSIEHTPPDAWHLQPELAAIAGRWTGAAVALAFRLALPVTAFLLLLDIALALLGRTQPQMQLITQALPIKMGASLMLLAWQTVSVPDMLRRVMEGALEHLGRVGVYR
jgi:flagellar biosynthesis protein FliR